MGVVAGATVVSRILGLVREIFVAASFGLSAINSAFVSAFTLPNLFRRLLGEGALTAAFVPTLAEELEHRQRGAAFALLSRVASWLLVVTVGLVLLGMLLLANTRGLILLWKPESIDGDTSHRLLLGAHFGVILFPYLVFVCLAAAFSAACQVFGRFSEPALSPVWLNLAIISGLGVGTWWSWGDMPRMHLVCAGVLVGGFLQMAVPAAVLWQEGWRPRFDLTRDAKVREIVNLMAPTVIGSAIYLINISVSRFIGLSLNDNAATALNLATRVMELPIGIFTIAIATVIFPLIARHAAKSDWAKLGDDYHKGLRLVLIVNVPAAVGLALLSEPIVRLLFQRGAFTATGTALMTPVLAIYALGLPFLSFTTVALRGFYALKDTRTPVWAAGYSFGVNVVLSVILMRWYSTIGLAIASNIAVLVQACYLQTKLTRRLADLNFRPMLTSLGKIVAASAVMGLLVWAGYGFIERMGGPAKAKDLMAIAGLIPLACLVYGGLLLLFRIEGRAELREVVDKLRAKLGRKA